MTAHSQASLPPKGRLNFEARLQPEPSSAERPATRDGNPQVDVALNDTDRRLRVSRLSLIANQG
jgi:hypothetical protein